MDKVKGQLIYRRNTNVKKDVKSSPRFREMQAKNK